MLQARWPGHTHTRTHARNFGNSTEVKALHRAASLRGSGVRHGAASGVRTPARPGNPIGLGQGKHFEGQSPILS